MAIRMGTDIIEWVNKSRLLGINVDDKLTCVPHMPDLKKSFAKKLDLIRRSGFSPKEVLINFYCTVIILSSITYGLILWGSCLNADLVDYLERLHCRAARIIFNLPKDMTSSHVLRIKWLAGAFLSYKGGLKTKILYFSPEGLGPMKCALHNLLSQNLNLADKQLSDSNGKILSLQGHNFSSKCPMMR